MTAAVAVIPARGGSQGLPGKNLRPLAGRPLVAHTIQHAKDSRISRIIVSSDDEKILELASSLGCEIRRRPPNLATASARSIDAMLDAIQAAEVPRDNPCVLLQPTSPLRTPLNIVEAVKRLTPDVGSVVSVTAPSCHPFKMCVEGADGSLQPVMEWSDLESPRQELVRAWKPNGAIYVARASALFAHRQFFIPFCVPYEMSLDASLDVDTEEDLKRAELLIAP